MFYYADIFNELLEIAENEGDLLGHVSLDDCEPDRGADRDLRSGPGFFRVEIGWSVARDVEDAVHETGDVGRALFGDDAPQQAADGRTEQPEV